MRAEVDFSELSSHRTVRAGLNERRLRPASPLRTPLRRLPRRERLIEPYLTRTGGFRGGVGAVKGMGGHVMVLVGLLGRPGAGACQNLPQRRPAAVSAANETAEYQRFSSRVPVRLGSLWQIWTTRAAAGPGRGATGRSTTTTGTPASEQGPQAATPASPDGPRRRNVHFALESAAPTVILESKMHLSTRKGPAAAVTNHGDNPTVHDDPSLQATASGEKGSSRHSSSEGDRGLTVRAAPSPPASLCRSRPALRSFC